MARIRCRLFGCKLSPVAHCERCGVFIYDYPGIIENGFVHKVKSRALSILSFIIGHKCEVCGKRFRKGYCDATCSKECDSEWIPF